MKRMLKHAILGMLVSFLFFQSNDLKAFQGDCIDFQVNGHLEGPDHVQGGVSVDFSRIVYTAGEGPVRMSIWFGDGDTNFGTWIQANSYEDTISHTYASEGPYTVTGYFTGKSQLGDFDNCEVSYTIVP